MADDPTSAVDPTGMFTVSEMVTNIGNMMELAARVVQPIMRVYQGVSKVMDWIETIRTAQKVIRILRNTFAAAQANGFTLAVIDAIVKELGLSGAVLGEFREIVDGTMAFLKKYWKVTQRTIVQNAPRIAEEIARDPDILAKITSDAWTSRHVPLIIDLPSEPGMPNHEERRKTIVLPVIHLGRKNEIVIMSDKRLGRLFGFSYSAAKTLKPDDIIIIAGKRDFVRFDYQDFQRRTFGFDLHYHVGQNGPHLPLRLAW